jgi:hypothetical protein
MGVSVAEAVAEAVAEHDNVSVAIRKAWGGCPGSPSWGVSAQWVRGEKKEQERRCASTWGVFVINLGTSDKVQQPKKPR